MASPITVADAAVAIAGDLSGFDKAIATSEAKAKSAGQRIAGAFSPANMARAFTVAGAGAGLLFATASKGGAELAAAMADYTAATGASAEEAAIAEKAVGRLYKNNTQGMGDLARILAEVKTNLNLTGAEGEAAADRIAKYEKVTGRTGQGVQDLDDIMDSLNLDYEHGSAVLDQLIASQQKFGGPVGENAEALSKLAPALNAANISVDDGIGLLNLFAASGIDAASAPQALTKALAKVKSPEELQALIADINATEDPFERAQKAADLFGVKAGAKLANALDGVDLASFAISADDAAGALDKASDAVDAKPFNILQRALRQVAGPLAEVGQNFGPLILGFTQLGGGKLVAAAGTAIGGLAGSLIPKLLIQLGLMAVPAAAASAPVGAAIAGGISLGAVALPALLIAAVVAAIAFLVANPQIVGQVAAFVNDLLGNIGTFLGALPGLLLGFFAQAFGAVVAAAPGFIVTVAQTILTLPFRILDLHVKLLEFFAGILTGILGKVPGFIADVVGFVLGIPGKIADLAPQLLTFFAGIGTSLVKSVGDFVGDIVAFFTGIPGRIASIGGEIVGGIIRGMAGLPGRLVATVADAFRSIRIDVGPFHISASGVQIDLPSISLPSFDVGSNYIPADMLAMVHRGEIIVPADEAADVRAGRKTIGRAGDQVVAGGDTYITNNHVEVEGLLRARDGFELEDRLRRLTDFGLLKPATRLVND